MADCKRGVGDCKRAREGRAGARMLRRRGRVGVFVGHGTGRERGLGEPIVHARAEDACRRRASATSRQSRRYRQHFVRFRPSRQPRRSWPLNRGGRSLPTREEHGARAWR
eukprot:5687313-Pleurochrysis_carterae.AAC.1